MNLDHMFVSFSSDVKLFLVESLEFHCTMENPEFKQHSSLFHLCPLGRCYVVSLQKWVTSLQTLRCSSEVQALAIKCNVSPSPSSLA